MKKLLLQLGLAAALVALPSACAAAAMNFGYVDAGKLFAKYSETQKTKSYLESEKSKLQKDLDVRKKQVSDLDAKYVAIAKKMQDLRDSKKEAEAKALEPQLRAQREALANSNSELQKFFEESQKRLYELEEEKMGGLSKTLDDKVDAVITQIAKSKNLEAVFEKRFCYFGGVDITEDVLAALNGGAASTAAPKAAPAAKQGK